MASDPGQHASQRIAASTSFSLPAAILILVLSIFPLLFSLALTLVSWDLSRLEGGIRFVGLQNFITLFKDTRFWSTTRVTVTFVVVARWRSSISLASGLPSC